MVGVGAGVGDNLHRLLKADALLPQQADQLGDDHAGMGVVDLDGGVVGQVSEVAAPLAALGQNQLGAGRHHQVLLVDAQQAAGLVGVVRVEKEGQALFHIALVKLDAVVDDALVHRVQIKQVQRVGAPLIAGDRQAVQPGIHLPAGQRDREGDVGGFRPAAGGEPGVGQLPLYPLGQILAEQAEVVAQADAVAGQIEGGQRVQEAGGQPAQTAVAQRGLRLHLLDAGQVLARLLQDLSHIVVEAQIDQVVGEQLADEELGRDIVELFAGHRPAAGLALPADQLQQSQIDLFVGAVGQRLAGQGDQLLFQVGIHICHSFAQNALWMKSKVGQRTQTAAIPVVLAHFCRAILCNPRIL